MASSKNALFRPTAGSDILSIGQKRTPRGGSQGVSGKAECLGRSDHHSAGPSGYPFYPRARAATTQ